MQGEGDAAAPTFDMHEQFTTSRIMNSLRHLLKQKDAILLRRRAAQILEQNHGDFVDLDERIQLDIVEGIYKILKNLNEDLMILSHIFSLVLNLSFRQSPLMHPLIQMGIAKLVANHAHFSPYHAIRDLSIQSLGDFAACCPNCQKAVAKTTIAVTVMDVLDKRLEVLTIHQQIVYSQTLANVFQQTCDPKMVISVKSEEHVIKVCKKLINLSSPNGAIGNGLRVLHSWLGSDDVAFLIASDETIMARLLYLFSEGEDDNDVGLVIRIIGDMAFSHDPVAIKIYDLGFFAAIENKLLNGQTNNEAQILWCLSNILGIRGFSIAEIVRHKNDLWDYLAIKCFSYEIPVRQEAIFCVLNVASDLKDRAKDEMYREFFGRLLIETLEGFTVEKDLAMIRAVAGVLYRVQEDIVARCYLIWDLIHEYYLQEAVVKRYRWIQGAIQSFELTRTGRQELYKILGLCRSVIDAIEKFKKMPVPDRSTVPLPRLPHIPMASAAGRSYDIEPVKFQGVTYNLMNASMDDDDEKH